MKHIPILFVCLSLVACASTDEVAQLRGDTTTVYHEMTTYQQKTDSRIGRVEKDVSALKKSFATSEEAMKKSFATSEETLKRSLSANEENLRRQLFDLSVALEGKDEQLKTVLGRLDELEMQLRTYWNETKGELKDLRQAQDQLRQGHEQLRQSLERPREPAGRQGPAAAPRPDMEDLYRQGFEAFQKGAYPESVRLFTEYAKAFPDTPLAPNAFFWMGEASMNLKEYEKAIVYYQEIVEKYPRSDKTSKALLRQAEAFQAMGDRKSSATLLKRVVELFPKTEEARVADRLLRSSGIQ